MDKKQIKYSLKTFKIGRGSCAKGVKNELPSYLRTMEHKILKKVKSNPTLSPLEFFSPQPRNVEPESAGSNPRRYNSDALGM